MLAAVPTALAGAADWAETEEAIERSGSERIDRNNGVAGEAYHQLGEIRRLWGPARPV